MNEKSEAHSAQMLFGKVEGILGSVSGAMARARDYLFSQQHEDGYWCGELEADTTLESDYITIHIAAGHRRSMTHATRRSGDSAPPERRTAAGRFIAGGPSNISASVKAISL